MIKFKRSAKNILLASAVTAVFFFGVSGLYANENATDNVGVDSTPSLTAKGSHGGHHGGGHHGGHHGHHGSHHGGHHGHHGYHHNNHNNHHNNHNHHGRDFNNDYWNGGGEWGGNPGYYSDPNYYYTPSSRPSVEYIPEPSVNTVIPGTSGTYVNPSPAPTVNVNIPSSQK